MACVPQLYESFSLQSIKSLLLQDKSATRGAGAILRGIIDNDLLFTFSINRPDFFAK